MTEPRRVRTQAERDADGTTWRATAASRPGYATYPNSAAGSPSWWLRYGEPEIHHHPPARPRHLGPTPCGHSTFGALGGHELVCTQPAGHHGPHRSDSGTQWSPLPTGFLIVSPPPRRRWWHRYTRRNP